MRKWREVFTGGVYLLKADPGYEGINAPNYSGTTVCIKYESNISIGGPSTHLKLRTTGCRVDSKIGNIDEISDSDFEPTINQNDNKTKIKSIRKIELN